MSAKEDREIRADFEKCYEIATRKASRFAEHCGVWTGTVSERLDLLDRLEQEKLAGVAPLIEAAKKLYACCGVKDLSCVDALRAEETAWKELGAALKALGVSE